MRESGYNLRMMEDSSCTILCSKQYSKEEMKKFAEVIEEKYYAHWVVDNLPNAFYHHSDEDQGHKLSRGFPVGYVNDGKHYINNHVRIIIRYITVNKTETGEMEFEGYRIVCFETYPTSVKHQIFEKKKLNPNDTEGSKFLSTCKIHSDDTVYVFYILTLFSIVMFYFRVLMDHLNLLMKLIL